ncbi:MAG: hypothetical protein ACRC20_06150 [Segniliparus sp.]|uniref:hypothetical protein n=1 Tax=Segniliparus sp. TaxID=2804064 RepID=UPI003F35C162
MRRETAARRTMGGALGPVAAVVVAALLAGVPSAAADPGKAPEAKDFWTVKAGSYKVLPDGRLDGRDGSVKGYGKSIGAALEMAKRRAAGKHEAVGPPFQTFGPMTWDKAMNKAGLL